MSTVVWTGPVAPFQVPGATVPGAGLLTVSCTGDGVPTCGQIADGWVDGSGRHLPDFYAQHGISDATAAPLYFGAFSAGGSLVKRVCLNATDRSQIRAVMLADATYTEWAAPGHPAAPEGFVAFAMDALEGPHLFVATASAWPNKTLPNGAQTLDAIRLEIEKRSGKKFEEGGELPGVPVQPAKLYRLGENVIFADYQFLVKHPEHATVLAPPLWKSVLQPWVERLEGGMPGPGRAHDHFGPEEPWWPKALGLAAGAVAGYGVAHLFMKRRG